MVFSAERRLDPDAFPRRLLLMVPSCFELGGVGLLKGGGMLANRALLADGGVVADGAFLEDEELDGYDVTVEGGFVVVRAGVIGEFDVVALEV